MGGDALLLLLLLLLCLGGGAVPLLRVGSGAAFSFGLVLVFPSLRLRSGTFLPKP